MVFGRPAADSGPIHREGVVGERYLFGPVASRRLGRSLGVDLIPAKTCPFDCVYCEVGRTTRHTDVRASYVDPGEVLRQLGEFFASGGRADYITFSGSGEPTLSADLGHLIREAKRRFGVPVAVITNGALLTDAAVRAELADADLVIPSLDSARDESFEAVNRPLAGISLGKVVEGLAAFVKGFKGRVWLEVLLVAGVNDSDEDIEALVAAVGRIAPERVQLGTVIRPPAEKSAVPVSPEKLECVAQRLSKVVFTEIVAPAALRGARGAPPEPERAVMDTLARRPCTAEDLASGLSLEYADVLRALGALEKAGRVRRVEFANGDFYEPAGKA